MLFAPNPLPVPCSPAALPQIQGVPELLAPMGRGQGAQQPPAGPGGTPSISPKPLLLGTGQGEACVAKAPPCLCRGAEVLSRQPAPPCCSGRAVLALSNFSQRFFLSVFATCAQGCCCCSPAAPLPSVLQAKMRRAPSACKSTATERRKSSPKSLLNQGQASPWLGQAGPWREAAPGR